MGFKSPDGSGMDHGLLNGLLDDDHPQYALLAGRAGGQTLYGGNAANDDLILEPTAHATKTSAYITLAVAGGLVGIGTATPAAKLAINGGLHVGGDSDPGDNNLLVDGTVVSTGSVFIGNGGPVGTHLALTDGDNSVGAGSTTQIELSFNNTLTYPHWITTRHNSIPLGNMINFYVNDGSGAAFPGGATLCLSLNGGNVGIGIIPSASRLAISGLPISAAGLAAGDVWVDTTGGLNILKIV